MRIWNMCDGSKTQEDIVDSLAKEAKVKKEDIKEAVYELLAKLEQIGLIEKK